MSFQSQALALKFSPLRILLRENNHILYILYFLLSQSDFSLILTRAANIFHVPLLITNSLSKLRSPAYTHKPWVRGRSVVPQPCIAFRPFPRPLQNVLTPLIKPMKWKSFLRLCSHTMTNIFHYQPLSSNLHSGRTSVTNNIKRVPPSLEAFPCPSIDIGWFTLLSKTFHQEYDTLTFSTSSLRFENIELYISVCTCMCFAGKLRPQTITSY